MKNFMTSLIFGVGLCAAMITASRADDDKPRGKTELVSVNDRGVQGNADSAFPSISADGRFVAFHSTATNLSENAQTGVRQIYVHDRKRNKTELISVSAGDEPGNDVSANPTISADGRFVAYWSLASNLVPGDTNAGEDVFVFDRLTRETERVSVSSSGAQAIVLKNIGVAEGHGVAISAHGEFVVFWSTAPNLVAGDSNNTVDMFVRDRTRNATERVSVASDGTEANGPSETASITADGRFVSFHSGASNLVPNDLNGYADIFIHDRQARTTELVSRAADGSQGNQHSLEPYFSSDGRYLAYGSWASNLVENDTNGARDVFVFDRATGSLERVSVDGSGRQFAASTFEVALSGDGRFAVMLSAIPGTTELRGNIWLHDRATREVELINVDRRGNPSNGVYGPEDPSLPAISFDGRYVAFWSSADNLIKRDRNGANDVFVRDRKRRGNDRDRRHHDD